MSTLATPKPVQRLIDEFSRLPGIGPKSASRLTYFLLRGDGQQPRDLAQALIELKERTRFCSVCFNITEADPCPVCADPSRSNGLICVVEEPLDVLAIERTGQFKGRYHVLHGALSPVEGGGRAGGPRAPGAERGGQSGAGARGDPGDERQPRGRGDRDVYPEAARALGAKGDAAGARPPGGRRPRVRGRNHAGALARGAERDVVSRPACS